MYKTIHSISRRLLPSWLYDRLIGNWDKEGLKKYSHNTSWVFIGKAFSLCVSFFTVAIIARYLGPENLGKISYAQSFIAIFSIFASFGIHNIFYRDLIANPEKEYEILGTALLVKLFFGFITSVVTISLGILLGTDLVLTFLIAILSLSFIIEPFGITSHVFTARVKSKYSVIPQIVTSIVIPSLKILVVLTGNGILFFAGIIVIETLLGAILSLYFYCKILKKNPLKWTFSKDYSYRLLQTSFPILLAGFFGYIFIRSDQVLLMHMLDATSVGLYQSAVQITEMMAGFLPSIILASIVPALVNSKQNDETQYFHRLRQLILIIGSFTLFVILFIQIFSTLIIKVIYGSAFAGAEPILQIYIWSALVFFCISILQQHLINEGRTIMFFLLSFFTALTNIGLNLILIPKFGVVGAAYASVLSLLIYLLLPIVDKKVRSDYKRLLNL